MDSSSSINRFPSALAALVALNAAVYAWTEHARDPMLLISAFAVIPYYVWHGVVLAPPSPPLAALTLFTAMFVHAGPAHLTANVLVLIVFGLPVLRGAQHDHPRLGSFWFLAFYLACGVVGFLTQAAFAPTSHVPILGASGAIAGLIGAVAVRAPLLRLFGCIPAILLILAWVPLQFVLALREAQDDTAGGTAYFVHIGGFCAGALLIGVFARGRTVGR